MWKSTDHLGGAQAFSISTRRLEDGTWEAKSLSQIAIPAMKATTEQDAVLAVKRALQDAVMQVNTK